MMIFKQLFKAGACVLIILIEFLTLVLLTLAILAGILLYRPDLVINEGNLRFASEFILPRFGVRLDFKSFQAEFSQKNDYDRVFGLTFENIRLRTESLTFIAPTFGFTAAVDLKSNENFLKMIGPIVIDKGIFALKLASEDPYEEQKPFEWDGKLISKFRTINWGIISANFKEINIERDQKTILKGSANLQVYNSDRLWTIEFESGKVTGSPLLKSKVKLVLKMPADITQKFPLDIKLDGAANTLVQGPMSLNGTMTILSLNNIKYRLNGIYGSGSKAIKAKAHGDFVNGRFLSEIEANANGLIPQLTQLTIKKCRMEGRYNINGPELVDSTNSCEIFFERKLFDEELAFADISPKTITVKIQAPIRLTLKDQKTYLQAFPVKASITPISSGVYNLRAAIIASFDGYLSASTDTIKSEIKLDSSVEIPEFQKLIARLEHTNFAIPAPLHTLTGRVACETQGKIVNFGQQLDIPLQCTTDLKSSAQALKVDVDGVIQTWIDRKPRLKLDVLFKDVAFELPQLRLDDPIPQFIPDKRIQDKAIDKAVTKDTAQSLPLELDISIKTLKSARLQTHVLDGEPVPVDIDIKVTGDKAKVAGTIEIKNYNVKFLKRKALVDHLTITLDPAQESPALDGLFVFKETDFRIDLILKGSVDRPFYYLKSNPPRSPSQLLSMLMYGGEVDALDTEGQRSVEETRAAMADGALGLLSMYYLASTPIDSVGYNPYTGIFRARVKIAHGLTLAVGSDIGGASQSVGIRKRLSENWTFETSAETDEVTNKSKGVTLFKWGRRY